MITFSTITHLADSFIQEPELKKEFHVELEMAKRYMKYGFNALAQNCDCIAHNIRALEGCNTKMVLFLGHRLRVMNQQVAIKNMFLGMEHPCEQNNTSDECVIVVDYKMKFEPCYYREKTVDHYGKRGISWHGAMVSYYAMEEVNGVQVPVLHKFYMDHIIENENKQDVTAGFAVLEP